MRFIVLVKKNGEWAPNGDGSMTLTQAERVAREIHKDCGVPAKVVRADQSGLAFNRASRS